MESEVLIRRFMDADEEAVVALWDRCGLLRPWNDPHNDIDRKRRVQPEWFLVAESAGRVVGSVMAGYEGHRGWVNYLAVDPEHRGRGLGRTLMEHVQALLLEAGCPKVNLQIRSENREAIAFYEAIGFHEDRVLSYGKRLIPDEPKE